MNDSNTNAASDAVLSSDNLHCCVPLLSEANARPKSALRIGAHSLTRLLDYFTISNGNNPYQVALSRFFLLLHSQATGVSVKKNQSPVETASK